MTGHRLLDALRAAWILMVFAVLLARVPPSQAADGPALKEALDQLVHAQREVAGMRAVAHRRLGPYELHTECTYCSSELLGICTGHATGSWNQVVDFSQTRGQLDTVLAQAARDAGTLEDRYAPAQAWIAGLPTFSARFDANADVVLGVEQAIRQGVGPNEQQRRDATQALLALTGELGRGSMQLDAGVRAIALSLEQQSAYRGTIRQAIDGADQSAQDAWRNLESASQKPRCSDGLDAKFRAIRDDFSRATREIAGAFERLDASSRQGEKALAALLDAVISGRTDVESVLRLLAASGDDQLDSFLGRLHLAEAKTQWSDLAKATAR